MKEGWEYMRIGEIGQIRRGLTYAKKDEVEESSKMVLRSNNVDLYSHKINLAEIKYLNENFNIPDDKYIRPGELLMCMSNGSKIHLGKVALFEEKQQFAFGGFMAAISHNESVVDRYLYYSLITSSFQSYIKSLSDGANINNLKGKDIENYTIPVPPLPTQQKIVSFLDAEFEKIDTLKRNAETSLQSAKDLFQSALKQLLSPKEGWEENTLETLCTISGDYGLSVSAIPYNGVRYLRITDITEMGDLNAEKVSADLSGGQKQEELEDGDLLFARTGATVGKTLVYKKEYGKCLFAGYLIRYRLNREKVLPAFMYYITHSNNYYRWVASSQKVGAQPNIGAKTYNSLIINHPSINVQHSIVSRLDALSDRCRALEDNYRQTLTLCDDLKQALLKQVFE